MNECVDREPMDSSGEFPDGFLIGDVSRLDAPRLDPRQSRRRLPGVGEADDFMPLSVELICGSLPDKTATCDEHSHSGRCFW